MTPEEVYEQLRYRAREVQGELTIEGFTDADYDLLYELVLEAFAPYVGNYDYWYRRKCVTYNRYKARHTTTYDFYDPHMKDLSEQTVREQLAVLKWVSYRWYYGSNPIKVKEVFG